MRVCRNHIIHIHKVFKVIAEKMKGFFGIKLHLVCNEKDELLKFMFTSDDVDDRKPLEYDKFVKDIYGRLVGGKGYISKRLFERCRRNKLKSKMKVAMMSVSDKLLLRKRAIVETVNYELKNIAQIEHSRYRCFDNFVVNMLVAIAAYYFFRRNNASMSIVNLITN